MADEFEFYVDLGAMSDAKAELVTTAMNNGHDCDHPLTAHTGTQDTFPWLICARNVEVSPGVYRRCGCQTLS